MVLTLSNAVEQALGWVAQKIGFIEAILWVIYRTNLSIEALRISQKYQMPDDATAIYIMIIIIRVIKVFLCCSFPEQLKADRSDVIY